MTQDDGLIGNFRLLAAYNRGANRLLYEACAQLSEDELNKPRPAFFKSIHGTLNHILLGDRNYLARFGGANPSAANLDAILYDDFDELRAARSEQDASIDEFTATLTTSVLERTISYVNHQGLAFADPIRLLLPHLFNHQTHHRGQIHDLLTQTNVAPPSLDMHRVLKPTPETVLSF
jgi:uncharacterized damage-inducible protein DinB